MRHHDNDQHDALNDYLDSLSGAPPADSRAGDLEPDLREGVDRFFDLAESAGAIPRASTQPRRPNMNATLPSSGAIQAPRRKPRRGFTPPAWTHHLHMLSTGLLIVAVIALAFAAFGPNGPGRDNGGDDPSNFAAVPFATVPPDAVTSTLPYPGPEECTVEPMTRDELVAFLKEANVATAQEYQRYERPIEPSDMDAQAIVHAYSEWKACGLTTANTGPEYQLRLQTSWYTANQLPVFYNYQQGQIERPISEEKLEAYADVLLNNDPADDANTVGTPVFGTPPSLHDDVAIPDALPLPDNATPISLEGGGRSFPTLFAEDIVITGPDTAYAPVYFVNEHTSEVSADGTKITYGFVKVDGRWLIDSYREGIGG